MNKPVNDVEESSLRTGRQDTQSSDGFEMGLTDTKNPMNNNLDGHPSHSSNTSSRSLNAKEKDRTTSADSAALDMDKSAILQELGSLKERVRLLESNQSY